MGQIHSHELTEKKKTKIERKRYSIWYRHTTSKQSYVRQSAADATLKSISFEDDEENNQFVPFDDRKWHWHLDVPCEVGCDWITLLHRQLWIGQRATSVGIRYSHTGFRFSSLKLCSFWAWAKWNRVPLPGLYRMFPKAKHTFVSFASKWIYIFRLLDFGLTENNWQFQWFGFTPLALSFRRRHAQLTLIIRS